MARAEAEPDAIAAAAAVLDRQRRHNRERLAGIVHRRAVPRDWPRDMATEYLEQKLCFEFTPRCREGLELFWLKATALGLIERRRELALAPTWQA